MLFVTIFSLVFMEKKNLIKVDSSHTNITENVNNRYKLLLEKLPVRKIILCFLVLNDNALW